MFRNREVKLIAALGLAMASLLAIGSALAGPDPATRPPPRPRARDRPSTSQSKPPAKRQAKPPDVRRGEPYDGRAKARSTGHALLAVPRTLLFVPRVAVTLVSRATVAAVRWWHTSGLGPFLHRVCFAFDGRMVTLPTLVWERGLTPKAGLTFTTNLLLGKARLAGLHAEAAAGHRDTWHAALKIYPLGLPATPQGARLGLALSTRYDRRHDRPFFGRGYLRAPASLDVDKFRARFDGEVFTADATLRIRLWRTLALHLGVGADWRRQNDFTLPEPTPATADLVDALGAELTPREHAYFTATAALRVGGLPGRSVPTPGFRANLWARARVGAHDKGRHLDAGGVLEAFAGLPGSHRRLGLRAVVRGVIRLDDYAVPLLHLPCAGGPSSMRGFVSGRLCGESLAVLTAEYHHALHPRLWLSLFVDYGGAFRERFTGATAKAVDVAGGAALALRITRINWMRIQVAGSRDGAALFIGWGGAP